MSVPNSHSPLVPFMLHSKFETEFPWPPSSYLKPICWSGPTNLHIPGIRHLYLSVKGLPLLSCLLHVHGCLPYVHCCWPKTHSYLFHARQCLCLRHPGPLDCTQKPGLTARFSAWGHAVNNPGSVILLSTIGVSLQLQQQSPDLKGLCWCPPVRGGWSQ